MGILSLLTTSSDPIEFAVETVATNNLSWLENLIGWLFDNLVYVALGVIVFTLVLKTIVLPLDIYSRVKMKKQNLVMEQMRPQMEKLQKQYANDKDIYSQKVLELQKANGYNPLSACLPMIVSLVVFMFVFSAFSTYSQYANVTVYNNMVEEYNASVTSYVYINSDGEVVNDDGFLIEDVYYYSDGSYITRYYINFEKYEEAYEQALADNKQLVLTDADYTSKEDDLTAIKEAYDAAVASNDEDAKNNAVISFLQLYARDAAATWYRDNQKYSSMLWIGNIFYPDSMLNKVMPSFSNFQSAVTRIAPNLNDSYEYSYNEVTANLTEEKNTYNGYFVLIVLAIGLMFLQQFITMRSQKATTDLSSVDGSAARTNKWMMILMPIIYGIFSFFYSAAFSLYMITNTLYSLISTLIINKVVTVRFDKKSLEQERNPERKRLK